MEWGWGCVGGGGGEGGGGGGGKPPNLDFLQDTVDDLNVILQQGLERENQHINVNLKCVIVMPQQNPLLKTLSSTLATMVVTSAPKEVSGLVQQLVFI